MELFNDWNYPTSIRFGAGRIKEIADACGQAGITRPLLITDRNLATLDITTRTLDLLKEAGLGRAIFTEVDPNPNSDNVAAGLEMYREGGFDGVVAFGGGSALDLAKAVAFMAGQKGALPDYQNPNLAYMVADPNGIQPLIAVPTTAGTGSEVSPVSVIIEVATNEKKIILHPKIIPNVVICDPELTVGMPKFITAGTGLDVLAHCVEAYSTTLYHPMSDGIALEGMRLVKEYLPRAYADGNDLEARAHMLCGSPMGAVAFQKLLGAIHALSHAIGAAHHTHHGTTNAVCMPVVLKLNRPLIETKFDRAADYLGIKGGFDGFCGWVDEFNASFDIPTKLSGLGVNDPNIDTLVQVALRDPCAPTNPVEMTEQNTRAMFEALI